MILDFDELIKVEKKRVLYPNNLIVLNHNKLKRKKYKMEQFYKLLSIALADGELHENEKSLLLKKAQQIGLDEIEAEMIIEGELSKLNKLIPEASEESDGFLISNEELIFRTAKWVNRIAEKSIKVEIEPFPRLKEHTKSYHKYTDEVTAILNKINSSKIGSIAGMVPGVGSIIKSGLTFSGINNVQKLEHKEIVEIADKYLLILELRAINNEFMKVKFIELKETYKTKLIENSNKKGFRSLF